MNKRTTATGTELRLVVNNLRPITPRRRKRRAFLVCLACGAVYALHQVRADQRCVCSGELRRSV